MVCESFINVVPLADYMWGTIENMIDRFKGRKPDNLNEHVQGLWNCMVRSSKVEFVREESGEYAKEFNYEDYRCDFRRSERTENKDTHFSELIKLYYCGEKVIEIEREGVVKGDTLRKALKRGANFEKLGVTCQDSYNQKVLKFIDGKFKGMNLPGGLLKGKKHLQSASENGWVYSIGPMEPEQGGKVREQAFYSCNCAYDGTVRFEVFR